VTGDRYLKILAAIDVEFARNRALHGERIHCRPGCTDCCYHRFSITGIEAERIAEALDRLEPERRRVIEIRSREYIEAGPGARLPCPALEQDVCSIYEFRPLMCHKFGMPLYNPDKPDRILACKLNFQDGDEISDPDLVPIQTRIHRAWQDLSRGSDRMSVAEAVLRRSNATNS
jgi:Fe-S-cluster containining protein